MKTSISAVAVIVAASMLSSAAYAQVGTGRYTPSRPTVSPYLNLLRRDSGPIPNYYSLVRPQQQQQAVNQRQQSIDMQQQSLFETQQQGLRRVQEGMLEMRLPQANPTGVGGGFMNYGHFYSFPNSPGFRR